MKIRHTEVHMIFASTCNNDKRNSSEASMRRSLFRGKRKMRRNDERDGNRHASREQRDAQGFD